MKTPRPYQQEAINCVFEALDQGISSQLLVTATGGGKTYIATKIAERFKRSLFLCHREELIEQAAIAFLKEKFDSGFISQYVEPVGFINYIRKNGRFSYKGYSVGLIKEDIFEADADIVIGSVQTVAKRLSKLSPDYFDCEIIDECHNYLAKTFCQTAKHFTPKLLLGITATDKRGDNLPLSNLFDKKVFEYNIGDGIKEGFLVELDAIKIKTNCSLDKVNVVAGELNIKQLSSAVNTLARNNLIADSYLKYCKGRKFIAFACNIEHAMDMCDAFISKGINCTVISSDEELTGDRTQKVKDFRKGIYEGIINVNILTEGADFPFVSCIIDASPTTSWTRCIQKVGRGTRTLPDIINGILTIAERWAAIKASVKKDCIILDVVDNTTKHNIVNCWSLDRELPPEERVFITQENRQKLIDARLAKITKLEHTREQDERIKLIRIPRVKVNLDSENMKKEASELQLAWLVRLGHDTSTNVYTNGMCQEIFGQLPLSRVKVDELKGMGYEINRPLTVADYNAVHREIWIKNNKNLKK